MNLVDWLFAGLLGLVVVYLVVRWDELDREERLGDVLLVSGGFLQLFAENIVAALGLGTGVLGLLHVVALLLVGAGAFYLFRTMRG